MLAAGREFFIILMFSVYSDNDDAGKNQINHVTDSDNQGGLAEILISKDGNAQNDGAFHNTSRL